VGEQTEPGRVSLGETGAFAAPAGREVRRFQPGRAAPVTTGACPAIVVGENDDDVGRAGRRGRSRGGNERKGLVTRLKIRFIGGGVLPFLLAPGGGFGVRPRGSRFRPDARMPADFERGIEGIGAGACLWRSPPAVSPGQGLTQIRPGAFGRVERAVGRRRAPPVAGGTGSSAPSRKTRWIQ